MEERALPDEWQDAKMDEFFKVFAKEEMTESLDRMAPSLSRISLPLRYVITERTGETGGKNFSSYTYTGLLDLALATREFASNTGVSFMQ